MKAASQIIKSKYMTGVNQPVQLCCVNNKCTCTHLCTPGLVCLTVMCGLAGCRKQQHHRPAKTFFKVIDTHCFVLFKDRIVFYEIKFCAFLDNLAHYCHMNSRKPVVEMCIASLMGINSNTCACARDTVTMH